MQIPFFLEGFDPPSLPTSPVPFLHRLAFLPVDLEEGSHNLQKYEIFLKWKAMSHLHAHYSFPSLSERSWSREIALEVQGLLHQGEVQIFVVGAGRSFVGLGCKWQLVCADHAMCPPPTRDSGYWGNLWPGCSIPADQWPVELSKHQWRLLIKS